MSIFYYDNRVHYPSKYVETSSDDNYRDLTEKTFLVQRKRESWKRFCQFLDTENVQKVNGTKDTEAAIEIAKFSCHAFNWLSFYIIFQCPVQVGSYRFGIDQTGQSGEKNRKLERKKHSTYCYYYYYYLPKRASENTTRMICFFATQIRLFQCLLQLT